MRRPKRTLGLVVLLGLTCSVGVAWGCILWSPLTVSRTYGDAEASVVMSEYVATALVDDNPTGSSHGGPGWVAIFVHDVTLPRPTRPRTGPRPTNNVTLFARLPPSPDDRQVEIFRAGWPVHCFQGHRTTMASTRRSRGLVDTTSLINRFAVKPMRPLPLLPRWGGLFADTAFFASLIWLAVPGQFALRRHLRRRRGACPACGYNIGHAEHDACPECGAA